MQANPLSAGSVAGLTSPVLAAPDKRDPAKVRQAAAQFEGLLIAELFKTARESGGDEGWLGTGEDDAGEIGSEMAEQELARALASSGGFGLARLIAQGLEAESSPATESPSANPPQSPAGIAEGSGG